MYDSQREVTMTEADSKDAESPCYIFSVIGAFYLFTPTLGHWTLIISCEDLENTIPRLMI